jgi:DNA sulfur modification protein DndC
MELITMQELHEIRRIWLFDKHEIEDLLPVIYQEETGEIFPGSKPQFVLKQSMFDTLAELCGEDELHYQMVRDLISVEKKYASQTRRTGLFDELEKSIQKSYYGDRDDALSYARERQQQFDDLVGLSDAKDEAEETVTLNLPKFKK